MGEGLKGMKHWLAEHEASFQPPVCNKLMYGKDTAHKVMFVGGPNTRKDYHMNEGEELFYMVKGDMCLKVMEKGVPKDIEIKEGEMFLLPGKVPHSPQRPNAGSLGLVIERERLEKEMDGVRWFVDDSNKQVLYERWFHCTDLGTQLAPVIKGYFESEEFKTRVPTKDIPAPLMELDTTTTMAKPFVFKDWLRDNQESLAKAPILLFDSEFQVTVAGPSGDLSLPRGKETFVWQVAGTATVHEAEGGAKAALSTDACHVFPSIDAVTDRSSDCILFVCQSKKI